MRSVAAKTVGVVVALVTAYLMYSMVLINSLPLDSGERRAWTSVLETVLFAPTIWVTRPVHQALYLSGHVAPIPWLTIAEIGLLALLYGALIHQAIMGKLTPRRVAGWLSRRKLLVGGALGVMIAASIAGRVATAHLDFRKEVDLGGGETEVVAVDTASPLEAAVLATTTVPFPEGVESAAIVYRRGEGVRAFASGRVENDPSDFMSSWADLTVIELAGDEWVVRRRLDDVPMRSFSNRFRPPSDPSCAGMLIFSGPMDGQRLIEPFSDNSSVQSFPPYIESPAAFEAGGAVWVVGLGFGWEDWDGPSVSRISAYENPNFATDSIGVFQLDPLSGGVRLAGVCDHFTDHSIKTLDTTMDSDGLLHLVAVEVLTSNENSLRMHYLRFDTKASSWIGDDVVWGSQIFTSSVKSLIRLQGGGVEMLWGLTRSPDEEPGGVFAHRAGDSRVFRLTDREEGFLAALADPLPGVEMVVGRVDSGAEFDRTPGLSQEERLMRSLEANRRAMERGESTVEWFVKQGDSWRTAGTTTVPARLYDMSEGQTGFWLWPEGDGRLGAAFQTENGVIVQEIAFSEPPGDPPKG